MMVYEMGLILAVRCMRKKNAQPHTQAVRFWLSIGRKLNPMLTDSNRRQHCSLFGKG